MRRKKSNRGRTRAIICSAIAIALTCLFIMQSKYNESISRPVMASRSLAASSSALSVSRQNEPVKARYFLVRESDLARMPVGLRISSQ